MRLIVRHRTSYRFERPQGRLIQLARLTPPSFAGQTVTRWQVDVDHDARLRPARDGYGNQLTMIYLDGPLDAVEVTVSGEVLTQDRAGVVAGAPEPLPPAVFLRDTPLTVADAGILALAAAARDAGQGALARLHALNGSLRTALRFDVGGTDVARPAGAALAAGQGVCQDFAHLFCAAARAMDVPARYVSGHLHRRDQPDAEQPAAHAWAEGWVEGLGWVGFDGANGICPDDAYVRVAVGLDYREAAPIAGTRVGGGAEALAVAVSVREAGR